ncbi:CCHC-type domain-containing protein [Trichonephila clavipes]|uniref:CCHC-type domain-containing protein n=1 Tax=Trichonephila clavipes TaxID=2585209 RepID=A0A8X6VY69_TRICX|nr:CCHC-type domain-containing protein [Trichonephila clavipes]
MLDSETATHIGVLQGEEWYKPRDLGKQCDIFYASKGKSYDEPERAKWNDSERRSFNGSWGKQPFGEKKTDKFSSRKSFDKGKVTEIKKFACFTCGSDKHVKQNCPKNKGVDNKRLNVNKVSTEGTELEDGTVTARVDLLGKVIPRRAIEDKLSKLVKTSISVDGKLVHALVDSGTEITVIKKDLVPGISVEGASTIYLKGIFRSAVKCPLVYVPIGLATGGQGFNIYRTSSDADHPAAKDGDFQKFKLACIAELQAMPDHHPDEPFYRRAVSGFKKLKKQLTWRNRISNKRKEESDFEYPPLRKTTKKQILNIPNDSISISPNRFSLPSDSNIEEITGSQNAIPVVTPKPHRPLALPLPAIKTPLVVLKGLPHNFKVEEIQADLEELGFTPEKVNQLIGRRSKQPIRLTESISEGFKKEEHGSGLSGYPESLRPCLDLGLTFKLITYDIPSPLIHLIHSYLTNRSFRIRVNESLSNSHSISAGCPQGLIARAPVVQSLYK